MLIFKADFENKHLKELWWHRAVSLVNFATPWIFRTNEHGTKFKTAQRPYALHRTGVRCGVEECEAPL